MKKVVFQVSDDDFEFAKRQAGRDGYFGPADCLNGIFSSALDHFRSNVEDMSVHKAEKKRFEAIIDAQAAEIRALERALLHAIEGNVRLRAHIDEVVFGPRDPPRPSELKDKAQRGKLDDDIPF